LNENIESETGKKWLYPFVGQDALVEYTFNSFSNALVRISLLSTPGISEMIKDTTYEIYMNKLYGFNVGDKKVIKETYDEVKDALFMWQGSPKKEYVYINKQNTKYMLAQKINLKPQVELLNTSNKHLLEFFKSTILLSYHDGANVDFTFLEIDYQLYRLLEMVRRGYCPNKNDQEDAVRFVEFINKIMGLGNKREELLIHYPNDRRMFTFRRNDFGAFTFEREV
jgi:DNA phosphorothioation-dependent restriction protein DptF